MDCLSSRARKGRKEGRWEGGIEGGREGGRERGREEGQRTTVAPLNSFPSPFNLLPPSWRMLLRRFSPPRHISCHIYLPYPSDGFTLSTNAGFPAFPIESSPRAKMKTRNGHNPCRTR
jgi:hypothetical protein